MEIQESKTVWVAWTNTDCTEGRGAVVPFRVAATYEAAARLGSKGGVQGSNCHVSESIAVKVNNTWLVPGRIFPESQIDQEKRKFREARAAALKKAKDLGLSEHDIAALNG